MPDLSVRTTIACQILDGLRENIPSSTACLRGSLANGTSDAYSDIDVLWEVDDAQFPSAVRNIHDCLSKIHVIQSLRIDPEFRNSPRHRLIFLRFEDLPPFWRVDLEIFARSALRNPDCDPRASDLPSDWSLTESALANAVAAIKACKRGKPKQAQKLLEGAFVRLNLQLTAVGAQEAIMQLLNHAKKTDSRCTTLASEIERLISL
ncbi:nucleotidyltransferase domain-containing protein [Edaphobacter albus]|uniref:nucleotidyltransferase domain-containing protein n=1 Tax=Edaphobacter sp. 4G125 TaxID=2763071 RepID=UPI00164750DC|nr:nucleotidyltransferase domain-containing protein [Edaphobacter sp. 4G125]QNI37895.1 hypothetical protein H7846_06390 [Edaphobacter sp. 4G125]